MGSERERSRIAVGMCTEQLERWFVIEMGKTMNRADMEKGKGEFHIWMYYI